jgi:hypothetical protein
MNTSRAMACGPELSEFGGCKAAHEVIYQGTQGSVLIPLKNKIIPVRRRSFFEGPKAAARCQAVELDARGL